MTTAHGPVARPARFEPSPGSIPTLAVPDMTGWRRLHFIGIGGAGMSGLARVSLARGIAVTGSDLKDSKGLDALRETGAIVFVGHREEQVAGEEGPPDAVVVSSAIPQANAELAAARAAGIPVLMRAQVLAALMRGRRGIAVAGTHGKTTTTSMISVMLARLGLDPSFVIGGDLNESGSGAQHGGGRFFVAEADESDGSFLLLRPDIGVITNVEEDHLDFYSSREEIEAAFAQFAEGCGTVVAWWDDPGVRRALTGTGVPVIRHGFDPGLDVVIAAHELSAAGSRSTIVVRGREVEVELAVPGEHNVRHAAEALAVADLAGVPVDRAARALRSFTGVRRRFEVRGEAAGATFVDDYAHHPSEVSAVLDAARVGHGDRIVAVFQPHRYTRTEAMWQALGESLRLADLVVLTDVYGAGELPIPGVTGKLVVDALVEAAPGMRVVYLPHRSDLGPFLAGEVRQGDLVLTLGAGDITMVGDEALERIRGRSG